MRVHQPCSDPSVTGESRVYCVVSQYLQEGTHWLRLLTALPQSISKGEFACALVKRLQDPARLNNHMMKLTPT